MAIGLVPMWLLLQLTLLCFLLMCIEPILSHRVQIKQEFKSSKIIYSKRLRVQEFKNRVQNHKLVERLSNYLQSFPKQSFYSVEMLTTKIKTFQPTNLCPKHFKVSFNSSDRSWLSYIYQPACASYWTVHKKVELLMKNDKNKVMFFVW